MTHSKQGSSFKCGTYSNDARHITAIGPLSADGQQAVLVFLSFKRNAQGRHRHAMCSVPRTYACAGNLSRTHPVQVLFSTAASSHTNVSINAAAALTLQRAQQLVLFGSKIRSKIKRTLTQVAAVLTRKRLHEYSPHTAILLHTPEHNPSTGSSLSGAAG